jgi:hypothetical protein
MSRFTTYLCAFVLGLGACTTGRGASMHDVQQFASDRAAVEADLKTLKTLLERE